MRQFWIKDGKYYLKKEYECYSTEISTVDPTTRDYMDDFIKPESIHVIDHETFQKVLEENKRLVEVLENVANNKTPELSDSTNYVTTVVDCRQALAKHKEFMKNLGVE